MMVYVNGQDIGSLVLGSLDNGQWSLGPTVLEVRPEGYLSSLEAWLHEHGIERSMITGFVLVKGPGSATSLRTSHALVNAMAFALNVEVTSLEKAPEAPDADILSLLADHMAHPFALPTYTHEPTITQTNRDQLKRKTS
jgi:hypothetical protein